MIRPVKSTLVGKRFGRLAVVERLHGVSSKQRPIILYRCVCDCGIEVVKPYANLYSGNTRSCGCFSMELKRARKLSDEDIRLHEIGRYYRRNAKIAKHEWALTEGQLRSIVSQPCTYCGYGIGGYIGVDRVDSSKGYHLPNVVPCCKICNQAKSTQTIEEFKGWVQRVHQHLRLGANGEHP
jgi:hypothetical protein